MSPNLFTHNINTNTKYNEMNHNINWKLDHLKIFDCFKSNNIHGDKYVFSFTDPPSFSLWRSKRIESLLISSHFFVYLMQKKSEKRENKTEAKQTMMHEDHFKKSLPRNNLFYSKCLIMSAVGKMKAICHWKRTKTQKFHCSSPSFPWRGLTGCINVREETSMWLISAYRECLNKDAGV